MLKISNAQNAICLIALEYFKTLIKIVILCTHFIWQVCHKDTRLSLDERKIFRSAFERIKKFKLRSLNVNKAKMELEISGVRRRSTRRREVFIVVLLVVLFSVAAFLIGYFAMKAEENTVICRPGDGRDGNGKKPKEKYHDMFQEEVKAKNIEENLRWELSLILFTYAKGLRNKRDLLALFIALMMISWRVPQTCLTKYISGW